MSDYLSNLVAKSRNVASLVQPRPVSPFEPSSPTGIPGADRAGPEVETALEARFSRDTPFDDRAPASTPVLHPPDTRLPRLGGVESAGIFPPMPRNTVNHGTREYPVIAAGSPTPVPGRGAAGTASVIPPPGNAGGALVLPRHAGPPESVFTLRAGQSRPGSVTPRETASSIGPAPQAGSASTSPQDSAPTIKISIGRVDVRAVMPPAPLRRSASARRAPSLTLTDYLKQQNEKKR